VGGPWVNGDAAAGRAAAIFFPDPSLPLAPHLLPVPRNYPPNGRSDV
jgi:hypothetical protein